jgi:hypothetical protein
MMNFKPRKMSALAIGVAMGVSAIASQAAEQPTLPVAGASPEAVFAAGATINGGASYLETIPAADAVDLVGTILPAAADIGKTGSLMVIIFIPGVGAEWFSLYSGGLWLPIDFDDLASTLGTFRTKPLESEENFTILDGLIGEESNLAGLTIFTFLAYITNDDFGTLTFAGPAVTSISETPADGCPANTTPGIGTFNDKPVCVLSGGSAITTDTHLTAKNSYFLDGTVRIGDNEFSGSSDDKVSLTIDAGTTLFANSATQSFLLIDRSAKIYANGTHEKPIIMTYDGDEEGSESVDPIDDRGKWGGVIINGRAQLNSQSGTDQGEGGTGEFGGGSTPVNDDDSGSMTYVQIRYAGDIITEEDELNSLALQGVGSKTNIDFINIHNGADDGVEFYGGTVNARHLVLTGNDDDAVDWTLGWSGYLQHVVVKQTTSGDNCIEADNLGSNPTADPRSIPTVANFTCVGSPEQKGNGHAWELKAGTGMNMFNSVIGGTFPPVNEGCIRIANQETFDQSTDDGNISGLNGTLTMENSLISADCANDLQGASTAPGSDFTATNWYNAQLNGSAGEVDLGGPRNWANGWSINSVEPADLGMSWFESTDYIGAIKDDTSDWTKGWTFDGFEE